MYRYTWNSHVKMNSLSSSQTIFRFYLCCISKLYYSPELHYIILNRHSYKFHILARVHDSSLNAAQFKIAFLLTIKIFNRKKYHLLLCTKAMHFLSDQKWFFFSWYFLSHLMTTPRCSNRFLASQLQTSSKKCMSVFDFTHHIFS